MTQDENGKELSSLNVEFIAGDGGNLEIRNAEFGHTDHAVLMLEFGHGAGSSLHVRVTSDAPDTFDPRSPIESYTLLADTLRGIAEFIEAAVAANPDKAAEPFERDDNEPQSPFPKP